MTLFGLDENEVRNLVTAVAMDCAVVTGDGPSADEPDAVGERFARAAWTTLAEPGDRVAGILVAAAGASDALSAIIERRTAAQLREQFALDELGGLEDGIGELEKALDRWRPRLSSETTLRALRQADRFDTRLLVPGDALWPAGVDDLQFHAPLALWVRGTDDALASLDRGMALVGARAATGYGEHVTMEASAGLVDRGYAIVSGAAYGIDGMAHRSALASSGSTVAFLAGGLDRFYPSGHEALLTRIAEVGAVVSEVPCGVPPTKWRFLQRNRLIAAASRATIVLEAGWRSGSLNTAGHAAALGRPLGAVPGPVTSAASAGCHRLIRDYDAVCVTTPDEMAELDPRGAPATASASEAAASRDREPTRLVDAMSARSARPASDIAARAGLTVAEVQSALGALELEGRVRERDTGWVLVRGGGDA